MSDKLRRTSWRHKSMPAGRIRSINSTHDKNDEETRTKTDAVAKIILVGETGSGKSTLINYLANYFKHGTLDSLKIAIPSKHHRTSTEGFKHSERNLDNVTESMTDHCNEYLFTDPYTSKHYLFIDTPGLNDTRNVEGHHKNATDCYQSQDDKNMKNIVESAENLGSISCLIIVINGTITRETLAVKSLLTRLKGFIPNAILDNTIIVLTNIKKYLLSFDLTKLKLSAQLYPFYMQNSAFSLDPEKRSQARQALQADWDDSILEIRRMLSLIDTFQAAHSGSFTELRNKRDEIKAKMHQARLDIMQIQSLQEKMKEQEKGINNFQNDEIAYSEYKTTEFIEETVLVPSEILSTLCLRCDSICHRNCGLEQVPSTDQDTFLNCSAIWKENCVECKHRCHYSLHYHDYRDVEVVLNPVEQILQAVKDKYDAATNNLFQAKQSLKTIQTTKVMLETALDQKNTEVQQLCDEVKVICRGFNLVDELNVMINELKLTARIARTTEARSNVEKFIESMEKYLKAVETHSPLELPTEPKIIEYVRPASAAEHMQRNSTHSPLSSPAHGSLAEAKYNLNRKHQLLEPITTASTIPVNHCHLTSSEASSDIHQATATTSLSEDSYFQNLSTDELLAMYNQKLKRSKEKTKSSIYDELRRRCIGESAEVLVSENKSLYNQIKDGFNEDPFEFLEAAYSYLKATIYDTIGEDPTKIKELSTEILVKAAVLVDLIHEKAEEIVN